MADSNYTQIDIVYFKQYNQIGIAVGIGLSEPLISSEPVANLVGQLFNCEFEWDPEHEEFFSCPSPHQRAYDPPGKAQGTGLADVVCRADFTLQRHVDRRIAESVRGHDLFF